MSMKELPITFNFIKDAYNNNGVKAVFKSSFL